MSAQEIQKEFPRLALNGFKITSPKTDQYNCIAWAGDDDTEKWDPDSASGRYWPDQSVGVPRTLDEDSFVKLYEAEGGYKECDNGDLEHGFEKIAIFAGLNKEVTHAARQLQSGQWTSKLGDWEDIEHADVTGLEGGFYGKVARFLKRPIAPPTSSQP